MDITINLEPEASIRRETSEPSTSCNEHTTEYDIDADVRTLDSPRVSGSIEVAYASHESRY